MLNLLLDYARREGLATEPGFKVEPVRWLLSFSADGTFLGVIPQEGESPKGRNFVLPRLSQPEMKAGGVGTRHFLCDTLEVVTLFGAEDPIDLKLGAKHDFFVAQLREASDAMAVLAVLADALDDEATRAKVNASLIALNKPAKALDNATFHIAGHEPEAILVNDGAWRDWYGTYRETLQKNKSKRRMISLAGGRAITPVKTHPKVTGLVAVGGQKAGDVLASFKQPSFRHFGFEQSENAAISEDEAAAYCGALNHLIREKAVNYAGAKSVYWYSGRLPNAFSEIDPIENFGLFGTGTNEVDEDAEGDQISPKDVLRFEDRARKVLESIRNGDIPEVASARFHLLTLAANSGRVVVRDVAESDLTSLLEALLAWRDRLTVKRLGGRTTVVPAKLELLLTSLLPPKPPGQQYGDWIKPVHRLRDKLFREAIGLGDGSVLRAAVTQLLPQWRAAIMNGEFNEAVASEKTKGGRARINARVALMKAFLLQEGQVMEPGLKVDHPNDAYHYGRLLAVLADLQRAALPDVKANVVQRYYPRASTSPAEAIGPLIRLSNSHLDKIDKGLANFLQARIAEIFAAVRDPDPPKTLDVVGQSLFAMGFYQQIAQMNFDRAENAAKKRAKNDSKVENPEAGDENAQ